MDASAERHELRCALWSISMKSSGIYRPLAIHPPRYPMLRMLKQARAFGVGIVLVTQNPVDLDYKGLSNTGTWFIGKLQTDQDKQRLLDGLARGAGRLDGSKCIRQNDLRTGETSLLDAQRA